MGLLDDAIREHLDLKRRRGGDPAEIERSEREALGPVRREPAVGSLSDDLSIAAGGQEPQRGTWESPESQERRPQHRRGLLHRRSSQRKPAGDSTADDAQVEAAANDRDAPVSAGPVEPGAEPVDVAVGPASETPAPSEPEDLDIGVPGTGRHAEPPPTVRKPADEPEPDAGETDEKVGETVEYDVEGAFTETETPAEEDVLEETPEFLQDTPDHDRLWFEQRPPRDFDFEG
jgi:hypothetical protein